MFSRSPEVIGYCEQPKTERIFLLAQARTLGPTIRLSVERIGSGRGHHSDESFLNYKITHNP